MANLTLTIGGRPLKIQCSDDNVETVKEIASSISKLIDDEKKENVPFLTSTLIAYLKSMAVSYTHLTLPTRAVV